MAKRKVLHLIGQAHLDPVWLWPWRDGVSEALTTVQSALDRMEETPGFTFVRSSAAVYRWVQEMDARLFEMIKARVREGRWEIVNGWIEQADCNIPSTESFVRHCLLGKEYFAGEFGVDVNIGYNVDSFGHAGGLPQVLVDAGYKYYVFMRPQAQEMDLPSLFWWQSPDGSRLLTWRIPGAYCVWDGQTAEQMREKIIWAAENCFAPGFNDGAFFYGVGNHGGGPTKRQIASLLALWNEAELPELRFSTLAQYFAALEDSPAYLEVPTVIGELQHHARGCYSAMSEVKALNRRAENSLTRAESLGVIAGITPSLQQAWWHLLFNQFHDILAGSSIASAYDAVRDELGASCHAADEVIVGAAHMISRRVDTTSVLEGAVCCINALPWARRAVLQLDTAIDPNGGTPITHLATHDGTRIPLQWLPGGILGSEPQGWQRKMSAVVELPAAGYRMFHLAHGEAPEITRWAHPATISENTFGVAQLSASDGTPLLSAPVGLVVIEDKSDTWGHDVVSYRNELGRPTFTDSVVLDDGPICKIVRQQAEWGSSTIRLYIITYRDIDAVELRLRVNWQETHQQLKLEVPTALLNPRVAVRTAGCVTFRMANGEEEPCQEWVALEGTIDGRAYTVGLLNEQTYSYDCLDGLLRTVVVRSAPFGHHLPNMLPTHGDVPFQDQGWQERCFWLVGGAGTYADCKLPRLAIELQSPVEYAKDSAHPGSEPWEKSLLEISPDSIVVTALKTAEDGHGIILRMEEMAGQTTQATVNFAGVTWHGEIAAWKIKSLRLLPDATVLEVDVLEQSISG